MAYTAYVLTEECRSTLKERFPPKFSSFIGHHVTVNFGIGNDAPLPNQPKIIKIIGYAYNDEGIEAFVVSVDGSVKRPDGNFYHITWSLESPKFKPKDSNELLEEPYELLPRDIAIDVVPALLK